MLFFIDSVNIDFLWDSFKRLIHDACHLYIPQAPRTTRYPQWFNGNTRHKLHIARSLRKRVNKNPSVTIKAQLNQHKAALQADFLSTKQTFQSDLVQECAKGNSSRLFQYMKSTLKEKSVSDFVFRHLLCKL